MNLVIQRARTTLLSLNTVVPVRRLATKFRKTKDKRYIVQAQRARNDELEKKASASGLSWRVVSSCVLHRYPVVVPDVEDWQADFWEVQEKIADKQREFFVSQTQGHPMAIPEKNPSLEEIIASLPFTPAPRVTEADEKNDHRSLERKLPRSLFLVVKRNRAEDPWQFPQGKLKDGETLRMAAERVVDRATSQVRRWFISNSPIGHYCYEYPDTLKAQRKQFGCKVYFYRAQLLGEEFKLETRLYTDYAWIAREEVDQYFNKETADFMKYLLCD